MAELCLLVVLAGWGAVTVVCLAAPSVAVAADNCVGPPINETHSAVSVPGSFVLGEVDADPSSVVVYLVNPLPPYQLELLATGQNYDLSPGIDGLEITVVALSPQFQVPGVYDFVVSYGLAVRCPGDCNGDGAVTIDELVLLVSIALEQTPLAACSAGDVNQDGAITVDEIVAGVNSALNS